MAAPAVVTIRPGVTFTPDAAASFARMETAAGRRIDVNSTYRDWNQQYKLWKAWTDRVPGAPYALHPDNSMHCRGLALDTDDHALVRSLSDHGWRQTAMTPGPRYEPWHFEYQSSKDAHRGEPAGGGGAVPLPTPNLKRGDMETIVAAPNGIVVHIYPGGKHNFANPGEYNTFRDQVAFLRNAGASNLMALPELGKVPKVTWDTFTYLCLYVGTNPK